VHVHLSLDNAGDGRVVEDADAVQEELVAREGAHLVRVGVRVRTGRKVGVGVGVGVRVAREGERVRT